MVACVKGPVQRSLSVVPAPLVGISQEVVSLVFGVDVWVSCGSDVSVHIPEESHTYGHIPALGIKEGIIVLRPGSGRIVGAMTGPGAWDVAV